jgi:hypothetical protein
LNEYEISINNPKNTNLGQYIELNINDIRPVEKEQYNTEINENIENTENTIFSKYLYHIKTSNDIKRELINIIIRRENPSEATIKIPLPSYERQKEIVEYCEYNNTFIKQLEIEIEKNNKDAQQQFIKNINLLNA